MCNNGLTYYMSERKNDRMDANCYTPHSEFVNFLDEVLHGETLRQKENELMLKGKKLSKDEQKDLDEYVSKANYYRRMKNYWLNKCVFPSMANLTVFLEKIAEHEELQSMFSDDLKQLFLGVPKKKPAPAAVFDRFVRSAITWNWKKKENANDFRLALIHHLEYILFNYLTSIGLYVMDREMLDTVLTPDLRRVLMCTKLLSRNVDMDDISDSRPVHF
jgi:hypothetical protein